MALCLISAVSYSQSVSVRGTVTDTKGEPIVGAVVMLKGVSNVGAVTDASGKYSLTVPAQSTIEASCMGYKNQSLTLGRQTICDFVLVEDSETLEEIVVVGYGSMHRSDLTGAVTSVRIDEDLAQKSSTLDQLLDGHAAGVQVLSDNSNPDAGVSIRIRGLSTFSGHSDPLYVVDGIIIEGESGGLEVFSSQVGDTANKERESTNALAGINPQDIASIEILKDASATAIYGSQGANGVVLITTKQAKSDRTYVNFNAGISISQATKKYDVLSYDEYEEMVFRYNTTGNIKRELYEDPDNRQGKKVRAMDWQDYLFRTAISQRYYLAIAGKPKGYNYHVSLGYNRNEGILRCTDSNTLTARLNLSKEIFKDFKLSFKGMFGYTKSNLINGANATSTSKNFSSIISSALFTKPYERINGAIGEEEELEDENLRYGPKRIINGQTNVSERFRVTPSLVLDAGIFKFLSFRSTFGADMVYTNNRKTKNNIMSFGHGNIEGSGSVMNSSFNWDNLLLFNWKIKKHSISGTLGESFSKKSRSVQSVSAQEFSLGQGINGASSENSFYNGYKDEVNSLLSFFGRVIYNWSDRYVLTATLRFDGSSKFLGANKWGIFPSAAFAWRMTSEPWFYVPWISNVKLRFGWGQVGNQNIGNYLTGYLFNSTFDASHYDTGKQLAIYSSNIPNPDLKWETTTQLNAGLDLSFLMGRLTFTADAYDKDTRDLLQNKTVAYSTGFTAMSVNDGRIQNQGIEFTIEGVPVRTQSVEWTVGANMAFNRNRVLNVGAMGDSGMVILREGEQPQQKNFFYGDKIFSSLMTAPVNIFIQGEPMGLFYGYVTDGIVQEDDTVIGFSEGVYRSAGTIKYKDLNGNGYYDDGDRTIIGNPHPKFTYGFNTSFSYKDFSLKLDFSGAYKFSIANMNRVMGYHTDFSTNCCAEAYRNAWTEENRDTVYPKFQASEDGVFSDRFVEDGSYLRISNISASYMIRFKKKGKVTHRLGLSLSVGNPFIWTRYSGFTPTTNSFGTDVKKMGVDLNSTPNGRTYSFDVKFSF